LEISHYSETSVQTLGVVLTAYATGLDLSAIHEPAGVHAPAYTREVMVRCDLQFKLKHIKMGAYGHYHAIYEVGKAR
jgi:hypothetical protein